LATRHQYRDHHCYLSHGFLDSKLAKSHSAAIQVKLDELVRVSTAKNAFVGIEHLTDKEFDELREKCEARAKARVTPPAF